MRKEYSETFTAEEIYVLAGAFGYSVLTGIDGGALKDRGDSIKSLVRDTVSLLEDRGTVFFGMNGEMNASGEVERAFRCLCDADRIVTVKKADPKGKRSDTLFFDRGEYTLVLRRERAAYRFDLYSGYDTVKGVLKITGASGSGREMSELMLFEEAGEIKRNLSSFMEDKAENIIRGIVRDDADRELIYETFIGSRGYASISVTEKTGAMYGRKRGLFLSLGDGGDISVTMDGNDVLRFRNAAQEEIEKVITGEMI